MGPSIMFIAKHTFLRRLKGQANGTASRFPTVKHFTS